MFSNTSFGMFFTLCISIFISIFIIYGGHNIWNYIKDNYSTKKTKDLVNTQIQKYKKIMQNMQKSQSNTIVPFQEPPIFLNEKEKNSMNQRLTEFMNNIEGTQQGTYGSPATPPF